jgi:type II secretory ATPase GspE/PulE/Tfp pilus assembly ATPase PilB-like protein
MYRGKGCAACGNTGYRGRVGIYELLVVTKEIEDLIVQRASSTDILNKAREQGMLLLFEDGLEKVKSGLTTMEELLRIAAPPEVISMQNKTIKNPPIS